MKRYVVGNWKCHKSTEDIIEWLDDFHGQYTSNPQLEVVLAPSFISMERVSLHLRELKLVNVRLAAQDVSPFPKGSYTGAVAADMVKPFVTHAIIGHSERMRYFHEKEQDVVNKINEAVDSGLVPIVCVEEHTFVSRLSALLDLECEQAVVAYTPVDALNFNIPEASERVAETVEKIRAKYPLWPVIYGGALNASNVAAYLGLEQLHGVFTGSASLEAETFAAICRQVELSLG